MVAFDASEDLTPFQEARGKGYGAILFDAERGRQVEAEWFSPAFWGDRARPVAGSGRGGAWFVESPLGARASP